MKPLHCSRHKQRLESGIALIIVMISVFVLSILAGGFAYSMKVETRLARNANSEAQLEWLGRSAVECARWELAQQYTITQYDSLNQVWAGGPGEANLTNNALADFKNEIEIKGGRATWTIVDGERKVNINTLVEGSGVPGLGILQQALMLMGADAGEMTPVTSSLQDWLDTNDKPGLQGAESEYYQTLPQPYFAKNGPIDDISELLLIKGAQLYYAPMEPLQPGERIYNPLTSRFGGSEGNAMRVSVGLTNLFTTLSSGKININTASAEVLQLIPGVTPEAAAGIVSAREGEDDGSML
ncbi:MAG TPA: helix-hairpin-helix domain-containing protein, partial [Clostridia bacterium]|nr:helix-hairpin-helix domain-containing protein [Clostridia bacterium]